jgi:Fic family protein
MCYNRKHSYKEGGVRLDKYEQVLALFEQQNQKLCYELLKEKIIGEKSLNIQLIKEIHKVLTSGTYDERRYIANKERPGEFKKHDYVTGIHEVGSAVDNVESDLTELIEEINYYSGKDILKAAAYLHARFEDIHPFADGNGRVGRTLMNYYLMTHNHPPLIVYDEDKRMYYECLQKYDEAEELNSLYKFLKYETEKTWEKTINLANGIKQERKGLSDFSQNMQ